MTDRMLSAGKVKEWVAYNAEPDEKVHEDDVFGAIDSGQLDADRPVCEKCANVGWVEFDYGRQGAKIKCDCGAKPEGER